MFRLSSEGVEGEIFLVGPQMILLSLVTQILLNFYGLLGLHTSTGEWVTPNWPSLVGPDHSPQSWLGFSLPQLNSLEACRHSISPTSVMGLGYHQVIFKFGRAIKDNYNWGPPSKFLITCWKKQTSQIKPTCAFPMFEKQWTSTTVITCLQKTPKSTKNVHLSCIRPHL